MKMPKAVFTLLALIVCVAGLRVASAVGTSANTSIILCSDKKTGAVRIIASGNCKTTENKVIINTTGPQGLRGATGPAGANGADGQDGQDGADGRDGSDGQDGAPGRDGIDGEDGATGPAGPPGADAPVAPSKLYSIDQLRRAAWFEAPTENAEPFVAANVGVEPTQAVFDGQNVWVVSGSGDTLHRINTRTNAMTTFTLPTVAGMHPTGIALMTDYLAVGYMNGTSNQGTIKRFNFDGSQASGSYDVNYAGAVLRLVSDSHYVWTVPSTDTHMYGVTDWSPVALTFDLLGSGLGKVVSVSALATNIDYIVSEVYGSDNSGLVSYVLPSSPPMVFDQGQLTSKPTDSVITGDNTLWIISNNDNSYTKVSIGFLANLNQTWSPTGIVQAPTAIATDGTDVYVVSETNNSITRIKASGEALTIAFDSNVSYRPVDIVFDGTYFWVINGGSSNLVKVAPF